MTKPTDQWMPLHISAYLQDTRHLTTEQHGAYMLLLMHGWVHGFLPDDDQCLANICNVSKLHFIRKIGPIVRPFFTVKEEGRLVQKRQEIEREKAAKNLAQKSAAARARYSKKSDQQSNEINANIDAAATAPHMREPDSAPGSATPPLPVPLPVPSYDSAKPSIVPTPVLAELPPPKPVPSLGTSPRLSDKPGIWAAAYPWLRTIADANTTMLPVVGTGKYERLLITVCEIVCQAAGIRDPNWRGDWDIVIGWLERNLSVDRQILPAIRDVVERSSRKQIRSLAYFNGAVLNYRPDREAA
jgi:uncharacterized protein YdaU (DUF1376 family)